MATTPVDCNTGSSYSLGLAESEARSQALNGAWGNMVAAEMFNPCIAPTEEAVPEPTPEEGNIDVPVPNYEEMP